LAAATQSLCKELTDSGNLRVDLRQVGSCADLPADVTLCVFRIAQEALRNCSRHSGAHSAHVYLEQTSDLIRLSVTDNGCGFDPNSDLVKKGLGFISMKERLRLVEGDLQIYSQPRRGTRIEVRVPLKRSGTIKKTQIVQRQIGSAVSLT
jgi:signal transduction histidine kinase